MDAEQGKYYFDNRTHALPTYTREHEVGRVTMQAYADLTNKQITLLEYLDRIASIIIATAD